jgi:hypothetical protein
VRALFTVPVVVSIWLSSALSSFAGGDLLLRTAIERIDAELGLCMQARQHRPEAVFRHGEDHGDRLRAA